MKLKNDIIKNLCQNILIHLFIIKNNSNTNIYFYYVISFFDLNYNLILMVMKFII